MASPILEEKPMDPEIRGENNVTLNFDSSEDSGEEKPAEKQDIPSASSQVAAPGLNSFLDIDLSAVLDKQEPMVIGNAQTTCAVSHKPTGPPAFQQKQRYLQSHTSKTAVHKYWNQYFNKTD